MPSPHLFLTAFPLEELLSRIAKGGRITIDCLPKLGPKLLRMDSRSPWDDHRSRKVHKVGEGLTRSRKDRINSKASPNSGYAIHLAGPSGHVSQDMPKCTKGPPDRAG